MDFEEGSRAIRPARFYASARAIGNSPVSKSVESNARISRDDTSSQIFVRPELDEDSEEGDGNLTGDGFKLPAVATRNHSALTEIPARHSLDGVFETSAEQSPPNSNTETEFDIGPVDSRDDSNQNFVLSRNKLPQSMYNYGSTRVSGNASITLGTVANDARYDPPDIQQNFGSVQIQKGANSVFGTINNFHSPALLGGLQALTMDGTNKTAAEYRKSRASIQVSDQICNRMESCLYQVGGRKLSDHASSLSTTRVSGPARAQKSARQDCRCLSDS